MGTLFGSEPFLLKYLQLGMEEKIPVMFPGGHNTMIMKSEGGTFLKKEQTDAIGQSLWNAGLPVLDDLHNVSYGFSYPKEKMTDAKLQEIATAHYLKSFESLQPGITMVIMHCTAPTEVFDDISGSGITRKADLLAMQSPALKKYLVDKGITDDRYYNPTWYTDTNFSLVVETTLGICRPQELCPPPGQRLFISEKTFNPFAFRHPFITYGTPYTLRFLQEFGWMLPPEAIVNSRGLESQGEHTATTH
jgi:hypothetical protein